MRVWPYLLWLYLLWLCVGEELGPAREEVEVGEGLGQLARLVRVRVRVRVIG